MYASKIGKLKKANTKSRRKSRKNKIRNVKFKKRKLK